MPAAAVIPAPRAYIKVVAVKKLVVEPWKKPTGPLLVSTGIGFLPSGHPFGGRPEITLSK